MIVQYSLGIKAKCPVDHKSDFYRCVIRSGVIIPVESIIEVTNKLSYEELYQEDLTNEIHRLLGVEVETIGTHSGVQVRVICGEGF